MIINELENIKEEASIKEELTRSITSFVNSLPEGIQEYTLYQLDTDPMGLFIKFYLLSCWENHISKIDRKKIT